MSKFSGGTLLRGSVVLLVAFNIFNILNFLFHFVMARVLTIAEYGAIVSVLAIFSLVSMPSDAIQNTITKYVALNKEPGKLKNILKKSVKRMLVLSVFIFLAFLIVAFPLSGYMKVGYFVLALGSLMIFSSFLNPVTRGILLGEKKFGALGANVIIEGVMKIILSAILVYAITGFSLHLFRIHGAIFGTVASTFVAFFVSFFSIRYILFSKEMKADVHAIYEYVRPAFFVTLAVFAFISIDVIIAKIVFDPDTAGAYAIASMLGKIIFFGSSPISRALFPITSSESGENKRSRRLFFQAMAMVAALAVLSLIVIALFPRDLIFIYSGKEVILAEKSLFYVALAAGFVSLTNLLLSYKLSIGKTKGYLMLGFLLLAEIVLLFVFSRDIVSFSLAFLSAAIIFLIGSLVIAAYEK